MASTKDLTIKRVTDDYLDSIDIHNPPAPEQVAYDIIALERNEFDLYNSAAMKCIMQPQSVTKCNAKV